jgi:hypothetical protein
LCRIKKTATSSNPTEKRVVDAGLNTLAVLRQSVSIAPLPFGQRKIMHCVIGSGPAGVACARALLARGANVLMLDAGLESKFNLCRVRVFR